MDMTELGRVVTYHRKRVGLSRAKLSRLATVSPSAIYDVEKGKRTVRVDTVMRLLNALNMSLDVRGPFVDEYDQKQRSIGG